MSAMQMMEFTQEELEMLELRGEKTKQGKWKVPVGVFAILVNNHKPPVGFYGRFAMFYNGMEIVK